MRCRWIKMPFYIFYILYILYWFNDVVVLGPWDIIAVSHLWDLNVYLISSITNALSEHWWHSGHDKTSINSKSVAYVHNRCLSKYCDFVNDSFRNTLDIARHTQDILIGRLFHINSLNKPHTTWYSFALRSHLTPSYSMM